ncbi:MAG: glycosyltransferase family 39 protein [Anaerolineae bacterium]|nr:glycosyltransferase family 39 protein [Anaerolineae bacterium]
MVAHSVETEFLRRNSVSKPLAPLVFLLALLLLGTWLRVHNLDAFSFWTDEGLTPARSGYPLAQILRNEIVIQGVVTTDTHPPLYYLIIAVTRRLFGLSDFAFRYPSVLFGVLLIPLLYQFGRALLPSQTPSPLGRGTATGGSAVTLGLLVALLAAVNPLQVYYSQEARMYTLLVLLATGMSLALWHALKEEKRLTQRRKDAKKNPFPLAFFASLREHLLFRHLLTYSILAALAVYTHYTIVFLVAAQALFWAWLLWRAGLRRLIIGALVVAALAAIPLVPYTLPRLLSGAEANYFPVAPLTMLQDVVRFFHLGLTVDFGRPLIILLNVLALALLLLGTWAAGRPLPQGERGFSPAPPLPRPPALLRPAFLLVWLLAPVLGLMLGSALFKPMYQGVRHIMAASPAFLLLVGLGIWAIWTWLPTPVARFSKSQRRDGLRRTWDHDSDPASLFPWNLEPGTWSLSTRATRPNFNPLALVPLALLLLGAALSLLALYTDPAYVKDDFRALVRFIETRAGGNDAIIYNNAVLLPLHEHYRLRSDLAVTALPAYPQTATGQEPELAALAATYDRLWFVTDPPADSRDDDGLIRAWLDDNLLEVADRLFPARTTEARVLGYATAFSGQWSVVSGQWDGLPALTHAAIDRSPLALPALWVDLWWRGDAPPDGAQLVFTLTGPDGVEHVRRAHPLRRPGAPWDAAADNQLSYDLPLPPGLPPGEYALAVGPEGQPAASLGAVTVEPTTAWPAAPEALFARTDLAVLGRRPAAAWPNGLALAAVEPWDDHAAAGNNLPLTLFWRVGPAGNDLTALRYRLEVIDRNGEVLRAQETRPGAPWLGQLPAGALLREVTSLYFRPETPPGRYRLRWTLLDGDAVVGQPVVVGQVVVTPPEATP